MRSTLLLSLLALAGCTASRQGVPTGEWNPRAEADRVLKGLVVITEPQVKGAHDAEMALVGNYAFVVHHDNDVQPGHGHDRREMYCVLTIVNLKTGQKEQTILLARRAQEFPSETLADGTCFVPRILKLNETKLRTFFAVETPGEGQSQTYYRDFDITTRTFEPDVHRMKMKTTAGTFEMQPRYFHADAVREGFREPAKDHGLYLFDSFKEIGGQTYVAVNNFPGAQVALARLNAAHDTVEIVGHLNGPLGMRLTEAAVNRLPDGSWLAICRRENGDKNYRFAISNDGRNWTSGLDFSNVTQGLNSKPTFDCFNGVYYLGWQERNPTPDASRSIFNIDVSPDGRHWTRKYRFEVAPDSFQYPTLREGDGKIWLAVTRGEKGSTNRIEFGQLE